MEMRRGDYRVSRRGCRSAWVKVGFEVVLSERPSFHLRGKLDYDATRVKTGSVIGTVIEIAYTRLGNRRQRQYVVKLRDGRTVITRGQYGINSLQYPLFKPEPGEQCVNKLCLADAVVVMHREPVCLHHADERADLISSYGILPF